MKTKGRGGPCANIAFKVRRSLPGTGKTTWLSKQIKNAGDSYGGSKVVVCSLTRSAAAHVAGAAIKESLTIPQENIGTLHAMAYRAVGARDVADVKTASWNDYCQQYGLPALKLSDATTGEASTKLEGDDDIVEVAKSSGETAGDRDYAEMNKLRARMTPLALWPESTRSFYTAWCHWKKETGFQDFTELLEIALRDCANAPGNPLAFFGDESQDWSRLAFSLARKWGEAALTFIHVGDVDQALFEWCGGDTDSFFATDIAKDRRRVLQQSWRIPRAVHDVATRWIEATPNRKPVVYLPRDADGSVRRDVSGNFRDPARTIDDAERQLNDGKSVMFCASCAYLLQGVVGELRARGIPFHNPYRSKRGDWNPLNTRGTGSAVRLAAFAQADPRHFKRPGSRPRQWTALDVHRFTEWLTAKKSGLLHGAKAIIKSEADAEPAQLPDPISVVQSYFAMAAQEHVIDVDIDWWIESLPPEKQKAAQYPRRILNRYGVEGLRETPRVIVSTIHGAKGGESDVVYLMPDLSPMAYTEWMNGGRGREGVRRAFYVGMTRARESLVILPSGSNMAVRM